MARPVRTLAIPIVLASTLTLSACSLSLDGPSARRTFRGGRPIVTEKPVCDTSKGLVALDGIFGATLAVIAAGVAEDSTGAAVGLGLASVAYIASALHGSSVVDECRDAQGLWEHEVAMRPAPPEEDAPAPIPIAPPGLAMSSPAPAPVPPPSAPRVEQAPVVVKPAPVAAPVTEWSEFWEETP